jgi:hypothetical protein
MLRSVALTRADVSEQSSASTIRVTRIGELGTLAVTSNARPLLVTANVISSSPVPVILMLEEHVPPKRQYLQEPHCVTSQKTTFFIVTVVKTLNPTRRKQIIMNVVKCKGKSLPDINWVLRREDVWGSGCIDQRFRDFGSSWRCVVGLMPQLLYLLESSPLHDLEKWKFLTLPGLELRPLCRPALAGRHTDWATATFYM